jgi:hypothetical protein
MNTCRSRKVTRFSAPTGAGPVEPDEDLPSLLPAGDLVQRGPDHGYVVGGRVVGARPAEHALGKPSFLESAHRRAPACVNNP